MCLGASWSLAMSRLLLLSSQIFLLLFSARASRVPSFLTMNGHLVCSFNGVLVTVTELRYEGILDRLNIQDLDLLAIQEDAFRNVSLKQLYLNHGNRISVLKRESFRGLSDLMSLQLDYNAVPLSGHLFAELKHLSWLSLSYNEIKLIPKDSFAGLSKLTQLNLDHNNIEAIETESFSNVNPGMSFLSLNFNNISRIAPDSFAGLTELWYLNLEHNLLKGLPSGAFRGLNKLEFLYLNDNWITSISRAILRDLVNLKRLYLNGNAINALEPETFQDLSQLEILQLQKNKLSHIVVGTFAGLSNLENLDMLYNNICAVDNGTFADLVNLHILFVDSNFTEFVKDTDVLNVIRLLGY